jgi:thiol-disulfide isomerase/thioredoxin
VRGALGALVGLLAASLLIAGCGAGGLGDDAPPPPTIAVRDRQVAPAFSVPRLDGHGALRLSSLRGTPVVVNFWASWCAPCKRETPLLVRFARTHPGIRVIGIAVNDKPAASRSFARAHRVTYALGIDRDGALGDRYGIPGLPSTILIDARGRIASTYPGQLSQKELSSLATRVHP